MARFVDEVKAAIRSTACAVLSANEFVNGAVGLVSPASRDFFNGYVNATRALVGCGGAPITPPPPPFSGGQCPTLYGLSGEVAFTTFVGSLNQTFNSVIDVTGAADLAGPITSFSFRYDTPGTNGNRRWIMDVQTSTGLVEGYRSFLNPGSDNAVSGASFVGTLVRGDNQPDDCGSPPPSYPPPTNINIDVDITYEDDDGNPINVTIPLVYAPITVNFDGSLSVPLSFDFGGFTFNGTLNLDPELNVDINLPSLPRGTGSGTDDLQPGDPDDEIEPEELDEKIIGVVVTATLNTQANITSIATTGMPPIFAPRLGSIKFAYSFGGATFWSGDIDIKGLRVFIPCPFSQGADAAVATPVPGVTLSFVEIRGFPLATVRDVS